MALMTSNASILLLAYCVAGLSLCTIDNGIGGRREKLFGSASNWVRQEYNPSENQVNPIVSRSAQFRRRYSGTQVETFSLDDAKEMHEKRRRTMMALMVMALLEGPNGKGD